VLLVKHKRSGFPQRDSKPTVATRSFKFDDDSSEAKVRAGHSSAIARRRTDWQALSCLLQMLKKHADVKPCVDGPRRKGWVRCNCAGRVQTICPASIARHMAARPDEVHGSGA